MPHEEGITPAHFSQFTGTSTYYRYMFGLLLTDGTKELADKCGAFWLMDVIASILPVLRKEGEGFAVCDLTVNRRHETAIVVVHNGNSLTDPEGGPYVEYHRQKIEYTDFPFDSQKLFIGVADAKHYVAYLPSEH